MASTQAGFRSDDTGELRFVFDAVASRWRLLLVAVLLGAAVAGGLRLMLPATYSARARVVVNASKVGEQPNQSPRIPTYRAIAAGQSVLSAVLRDLELPMSLDDLARAVVVREVPSTDLIEIEVDHRDPATAARLANAIATRAVAANRRLNQSEALEARDYIATQAAEARKRMQETQQSLVKYQQAAQTDVLESDVKALLKEREEMPARQIDLESARAELIAAQSQLNGTSQKVELTRSLDSEPALLEAVRPKVEDSRLLAQSTLKVEQLNPLHGRLARTAAEGRVKVSGLTQKAAEARRLGLSADSMPLLQTLYRHRAEVARLTTEAKVASDAYVELSSRLDLATVQVAQNSAELQVADEALPPSRPSSMSAPRAAIAGALAGLVGGMLVTVLGALVPRRLLLQGPGDAPP